MFILGSSRKDSDHVLVHCILPDVHKREGGPAEATDETTLKNNSERPVDALALILEKGD